jgi:hypothetical protein
LFRESFHLLAQVFVALANDSTRATFPAPLSKFSWGESIRRGEIYRVADSESEPEGLRDLARQRGSAAGAAAFAFPCCATGSRSA